MAWTGAYSPGRGPGAAITMKYGQARMHAPAEIASDRLAARAGDGGEVASGERPEDDDP